MGDMYCTLVRKDDGQYTIADDNGNEYLLLPLSKESVEILCDQTSAFWEVIIEIGKSGAIRLRKF